VQSQWFETFFQGPFVDLWSQIIPLAVTLREVDFLEQALHLGPSARVLDVPCGNGRHAVELARRAHRVTGVDLSREFLDRARRSASEANLDVDWRFGDMRELPWSAEFDGAFCFGNSFGYLDHTGAATFLHALSKALKPGGWLAIHTGVVAESILATPLIRRWHRSGDIVMLSEPRYAPEDSRLDIDYTFIQGGITETRPSSSYVFTVAELLRMLERTGFDSPQLSGGFSGEPFQLGSPGLVITARAARPESSPPLPAR
jgi:SAM-dependent methyltransferase